MLFHLHIIFYLNYSLLISNNQELCWSHPCIVSKHFDPKLVVEFVDLEFVPQNYKGNLFQDFYNHIFEMVQLWQKLNTVVCDWDHVLVHKYYINRVSLSQNYIYSKCYYTAFHESANRYDLGLSNEPLFIIMGQGDAILWPWKAPKKISPQYISKPVLLSKQEASKAIFSDLQLWQVTVMQPLDLW